jgi:hypothetical protein
MLRSELSDISKELEEARTDLESLQVQLEASKY